MAKKRAAAPKPKKSMPKRFSEVVQGRDQEVKSIAEALRVLVYEELPEAQESFYGGQLPMAMYRTLADVCWIQPLKARCNIYFTRGPDLTDRQQILEGASDRMRHAKVKSVEDVERLPIRAWIQESVALNQAAAQAGMPLDEVLEILRRICLPLPDAKETVTWGKPHFRVGEKIFCGCGEDQGSARIGLKMERAESERMMQLPGIEKSPYSREGDGWVTINPSVFADWEEIEQWLVGSYRLIAPARTLALLDSQIDGRAAKGVQRRKHK